MDANAPAKPMQLDYAPAPSVAWRFVRRALRHILLSGLVVAAYVWGPAVWDQVRMLYWQGRCLNFSIAPGQVIYDGTIASGRSPAPPSCWAEFVNSAASVGPALSGMPQFGSLVFLGRLQTPSGDPRLVAVAFTSQLNWWAHGRLEPGMSYQVWVVKPGSLFESPRSIDQLAGPGFTSDQLIPPPAPTFYFGQPDPGDPSHFTVRYKVWGQEDTVDGRIDDEGQVTLEQRHPPAAPG